MEPSILHRVLKFPPWTIDMFAFATLVALASAALPQVFAHGGVLAYSNAGNWYQGWYVVESILWRDFIAYTSFQDSVQQPYWPDHY